MTSLEVLQQRFDLPGLARIEAGKGNLPCVQITHPKADGTLYLHGAHLTRYRPVGQSEVLFLSRQSHFLPGHAIRGGVPICFPWFGPRKGHPEAPMHGLARLRNWELGSVASVADGVAVTLTLTSDEGTLGQWDGVFELRYTVVVGRKLRLSLEVTNRGTAPFVFEEALHTYLHVTDVRQAMVEGLGGGSYIDKTDGMKTKAQPPGLLRISAETDRVYLNTQSPCTVRDKFGRRKITVRKERSNNTVVWNPWIDKARAMADFGDEEWTEMLCIESANIGEYAIRLEPGRSHTMTTVLHAVEED